MATIAMVADKNLARVILFISHKLVEFPLLKNNGVKVLFDTKRLSLLTIKLLQHMNLAFRAKSQTSNS
jgi:hypothetical protein